MSRNIDAAANTLSPSAIKKKRNRREQLVNQVSSLAYLKFYKILMQNLHKASSLSQKCQGRRYGIEYPTLRIIFFAEIVGFVGEEACAMKHFGASF